MGLRRKPPAVMQWMSTLGAMKAAGTIVIRIGSRPCTFYADVDLDEMIALLGADGSLWDRQPPCDCGQLTHFMASPARGTPMRPLISPGLGLEDLPAEAWVGGWVGRR